MKFQTWQLVPVSVSTSFKFMGNFNLWPFVSIFINCKKIAKAKFTGPLVTTGQFILQWRNGRKWTIKIKVSESKPSLAWPSSCCWWWSDSVVLERELYCDLVQWNHQSSIVNVSRLIQGCHNHIPVIMLISGVTWRGNSSRHPTDRGEGAAVLSSLLQTMLGSSEQVPEAPDKAPTFILLSSSSGSALELLLCWQVVRSHVSQTRPGFRVSEVTSPPSVIPSVVGRPSAGCDSSVVLFLIIETGEREVVEVGEVGDFTVAPVERPGVDQQVGAGYQGGEQCRASHYGRPRLVCQHRGGEPELERESGGQVHAGMVPGLVTPCHTPRPSHLVTGIIITRLTCSRPALHGTPLSLSLSLSLSAGASWSHSPASWGRLSVKKSVRSWWDRSEAPHHSQHTYHLPPTPRTLLLSSQISFDQNLLSGPQSAPVSTTGICTGPDVLRPPRVGTEVETHRPGHGGDLLIHTFHT